MPSSAVVACGEAIPQLLEAFGVGHVFGIPGNHTLELYRGLASSTIKHISTRHEQGAAFMADGYARASGSVGVCFLISGPGLLNAATAIAQARADSVPMLIITAVADSQSLGKRLGQLHELPDQQAAASSFCSLSLHVATPRDLVAHLHAAFTLFATQRPGPVHIQIPLDVMRQPLPDALTLLEELRDTQPAPASTEVHQQRAAKAVSAMALALNKAQLPLCLFGGGVTSAADAWLNIAERLDAPVLNTVNAKGIAPADHPLAVGGSPSLGCLRDALSDADVVVAVGTEFGETDYDLLMSGELQFGGTLLRIDIDADQLTRNQVPDVGLVVGAAQAADLLAPLLHLDVARAESGATRARHLRSQVRSETHYHAEFAALFACLRETLGERCVVGDSTRPTYYAAWQFECVRPRRYFHSVTGFGTLGYSIPAAFGAAVALDEPVLAIIGDGGAQFTLTELATAVDQRLPVIILIWQNRGFEEIANSLAGRGVPIDSTLVSAPDFVALAAAYGVPAHNPRGLTGLTEALQRSLQHAQQGAGPAVIVLCQGDFVSQPSGQWYG